MQVKIYTDGAAREIRMDREATEQFFSTSIPKASYMNVNCPEATKKPQTTGWN